MLSRAAILGFVSHRAEATRVPGDVKAGTCLRPASATFMGLRPSAGCVECKLLSRIDFQSRLGDPSYSGDRLVKFPNWVSELISGNDGQNFFFREKDKYQAIEATFRPAVACKPFHERV